MTTVFHARPYGRFTENRGTSEERNFVEPVKAPVLFKAILARFRFSWRKLVLRLHVFTFTSNKWVFFNFVVALFVVKSGITDFKSQF